MPAGRAGGRTAEAPQYAAEATHQTKTATYSEPIPSFRLAASITAFILIKRSDSSDGPTVFSQSAFNNSPNSIGYKHSLRKNNRSRFKFIFNNANFIVFANL